MGAAERSPSEFLQCLDAIAVLHSLPDGVTLADAEGRIEFSNEAADRILGVQAASNAVPDEWSTYYGVFRPDGVTVFPTDEYPLVRALSGEHTRDVEMFIRNASIAGGAILSVSGQPLKDAGGAIIGAAVVFRDITELRQTQRRLMETIATLERIQRLREELSTFIVHDLKNPLSAILTTCELIGMHALHDTPTGDVAAIREAATRMHRMVLDMLDLQMSEDGVLELRLSDVSVAELLRRLADAAASRLRGRHQTIVVADPSSLRVRADEGLLFRVLMNLVDNCAKYGPDGGTVHVDASPGTKTTVTIRVRDEGPGVPPELRERIFEKYAQAERADGMRSRHSRGLGLRFCKMVVEAHGGRIWVEDGVPRGACFCAELASA